MRLVSSGHYRIGVDIGGTFTDLLIVDEESGTFVVGKVLTTSDDPSLAIEGVLREALAAADLPISAVWNLVHGTTLVTNAIIERKGDRTALLATEGFRDSLEIGRESRYDLYDLHIDLPRPLVPRNLRFGIPQRTLSDGSVLQDLDSVYVERLAAELAESGVSAVAIAFLNSYANPAHEHAARAAVLRAAPQMRVTLSAEVAPEIREFDRTSTAVANVYVQGRVERYLHSLEARLAQLGFQGSFLMMLSNGGIGTLETATRFPIRLLESGPAAGALAAASYGVACGRPDLLSFDMGGTTAKFCVITNGTPAIATAFEFDRVYRFRKGSGLPATIPVVEMVEIGAGGGSIARIDSLGLLKVGPDSAGADPGPACYARGGTQPTVTDADLVLGYLDPQFFLGGRMQLNLAAARAAIETQIATPLGISVEAAAWGIHQIVNQNMANAARVHILERGQDPQRFPLFAFGGAGPVHGYRIAEALDAPAMIAPFGAGVISTVGFLTAPIAFDFVRSWRTTLIGLDWQRASQLLAEMETEGQELLTRSGVTPAAIRCTREADMRYIGQGHQIRVPLPADALSTASEPIIQAAFEAEYQRLYGRLGPPVPIEIITWRLVASGPKPSIQLQMQQAADNPSTARKGQRMAYFPELGGLTPTPVYDRYLLSPGAVLAGPAIVEERESTVIVGPGSAAHVDQQWNVVVTREREGWGGLKSAIPVDVVPVGAVPANVGSRISKIDPVLLEIMWNRLLSVANEQQVTLIRTAFSTLVRESEDLACGVFDRRGLMIAQSVTGTPGHINAMATGVKHFLAAYPEATLHPGDVLLTNDPWQTAGQVNDFTVVTPVFRGSQIVAYFANTCHSPDIGGRILSAEAREVFEEGLRVPITWLFRAGEPNHELIKIIRANVRTPEETVGDLYAQTACNAVGARQLLHFMEEFGLESIEPLADEIMLRSEQAMRSAIRAIPNGRYTHATLSDGFEEPIRIAVTVTVADEEIWIDFTGSSPQSTRGINVVLNYTHAYASFAIKAAISPEVPHNDGAFRPVHVSAPEGSILNCRDPAPVASRHIIGHFLPGVIFGALAHALPVGVMAGGADPIWITVWRGTWPHGHTPFTFTLFQCGGAGARASKDGLSATGFPSGVAGVPAEVAESLTPLVQMRRELRIDSGGAGQYRGGLGQSSTMICRSDGPWSLSTMIDRVKYPAQGLLGGSPGAVGNLARSDGIQAIPKTVMHLAPDVVVQLDPPGGGGYGDPYIRMPAAVLADVVAGYVSLQAAAAEYGVAIIDLGLPDRLVRLPEQFQIDEIATTALRDRHAKAREEREK